MGELNERTECGAAATRAQMRPGRVPQQNCSLPPMLQQATAKSHPQRLVYSPLGMSPCRGIFHRTTTFFMSWHISHFLSQVKCEDEKQSQGVE